VRGQTRKEEVIGANKRLPTGKKSIPLRLRKALEICGLKEKQSPARKTKTGYGLVGEGSWKKGGKKSSKKKERGLKSLRGKRGIDSRSGGEICCPQEKAR